MLMTWNGPDGLSCSPSFITPRTVVLEESDSPLFKDFYEFSKACVVCTGQIPVEFDEAELDAAKESLDRPVLP